jgi:hypothetical protein
MQKIFPMSFTFLFLHLLLSSRRFSFSSAISFSQERNACVLSYSNDLKGNQTQFKISNIEQFFSLDPQVFIKEMIDTDDLFFLIFWYYYDERKSIKPLTSINDYHFMRSHNDLSEIFINYVICNYKRYIAKVIFRYEGDKDKLLVQAELLLNSKFYQVGKRIVGTDSIKYKILDVIILFQYFQKCICNDLYEIVLEEFLKLDAEYRISKDSKQVKRHLENFKYTAKHIWNNREELFGLRWLAAQPRKLAALYLLAQIDQSPFFPNDNDLIDLLLEDKIEYNIERVRLKAFVILNPKVRVCWEDYKYRRIYFPENFRSFVEMALGVNVEKYKCGRMCFYIDSLHYCGYVPALFYPPLKGLVSDEELGNLLGQIMSKFFIESQIPPVKKGIFDILFAELRLCIRSPANYFDLF